MFVYVINQHGQPLMPCTPRKARLLLKAGQAKVVHAVPFTLQLLYGSSGYRQEVELGVDAGTRHIGISATTEQEVLFEAEVHPASHLTAMRLVHAILPVSRTTIEVAQFDTQKLNNPAMAGEEYQHGPQHAFWNTRAYVLWRDEHRCQLCHGQSHDPILTVHHMESRKTGGDSPDNLVCLTYGYQTKQRRIAAKLEKSHCIDARCISGHPQACSGGTSYLLRLVRRNNRQLHKATMRKGGMRARNTAPRYVKGFRLFDQVRYQGQLCFIFGRRSSGYFDLRRLDGTKVHGSANCKHLQLVQRASTCLRERRSGIPPTPEGAGGMPLES